MATLATSAMARDVELIDMAWGYDAEDNVLRGPVFEGASAPPVRFETLESAYDQQGEFVRRIRGGFVRPLKYTLAPTIDLGALLTSGLRNEASTMGLRSAPEGEAVRISGRLKEAFLENYGVYGGAILFFSHFQVELELAFPDGRREQLERRLHGMVTRVNGGFGGRDEAGEATARLLVDAAQELVADIARRHLKAPTHPGLPDLLASLAASGAENRYPDLRRIGLSGLPEATDKLLAVLDREAEEDNRTQLLDALADLAAPNLFAALETRYPQDDDEDCRWAMLKGLLYWGQAHGKLDEARKAVRALGAADRHFAIRSFAAAIK